MTPNEITTVIAQPFGRHLDLPFKLQLFERVKAWRSRLISNSLDRDQQDRVFFQSTYRVPMEVKENYSISKTTVPKPMEETHNYYDYVGNGDPIPFIYAPVGNDKLFRMDPNSFVPTYDIVDNHLIVDRQMECDVIIRGLMDDPSEALCDCQGDYFNMEYPISYKLAQQIITALIDEIAKTQTPGDEEGNLTVPATEGRV